MSTSGEVAVRATQLVKDYGGGGIPAVSRLDLELRAGSFTSVMGPSGSGKSTLLHLLGGMDRPTSGEVEISGRRLSTLDDDQLSDLRRTEIGFVFQAYNLVPVLTAGENVALPATIGGQDPASYEARLEKVLGLVDLTAHRDKLPSQMSGGQQQRVALGRALFNEPSLVLADEPTGNLDTQTGTAVLELLRRIVDSIGVTILMVTHDPRAAAYGDEVILLRDGEIAGRHVLPTDRELDVRARQLTAWLADPLSTIDVSDSATAPVARKTRRTPVRAARRP